MLSSAVSLSSSLCYSQQVLVACVTAAVCSLSQRPLSCDTCRDLRLKIREIHDCFPYINRHPVYIQAQDRHRHKNICMHLWPRLYWACVCPLSFTPWPQRSGTNSVPKWNWSYVWKKSLKYNKWYGMLLKVNLIHYWNNTDFLNSNPLLIKVLLFSVVNFQHVAIKKQFWLHFTLAWMLQMQPSD